MRNYALAKDFPKKTNKIQTTTAPTTTTTAYDDHHPSTTHTIKPLAIVTSNHRLHFHLHRRRSLVRTKDVQGWVGMQYLQLWRLRLLGCSIHSWGIRWFIRLVSALPCPSSFCSKIHSYLFSRPYGWLRQCRYTVSFSISSLSLISIRCIQFLYFFVEIRYYFIELKYCYSLLHVV